MIKFDVINRYTGDVQFTAEIDCDESEVKPIKLWLAVKWAIENKADLQWADLQGADLREADLLGADLQGADLREADLLGADLQGADLQGANLQGVNLRYYKSDRYECYIQTHYLQIGCERYTWDDWLSFDDKRIIEMDGKDALKWWRVNKPILEAIRDSIEVE